MSATVTVIGADGVHRMLRAYTNPTLNRRLQDATKAGATVYKAPLKAEAAKVSKRLARSVSVRKARRDRPATVVTFRPKIAFFRHFVIGGTRDHGARGTRGAQYLTFKGKDGRWITKARVRGVKPNPIVARVAERLAGQAYAAINRDLDRTEQ